MNNKPANKASTPMAQELSVTAPKVGMFLSFNTNQVKGLRINLEKIRSYAFKSETTISLAWDNGLSTDLQFSDAALANEAMARIDAYTL